MCLAGQSHTNSSALAEATAGLSHCNSTSCWGWRGGFLGVGVGLFIAVVDREEGSVQPWWGWRSWGLNCSCLFPLKSALKACVDPDRANYMVFLHQNIFFETYLKFKFEDRASFLILCVCSGVRQLGLESCLVATSCVTLCTLLKFSWSALLWDVAGRQMTRAISQCECSWDGCI